MDLNSGASPGEFSPLPLPRPLPCWQDRGAEVGYIKKEYKKWSKILK